VLPKAKHFVRALKKMQRRKRQSWRLAFVQASDEGRESLWNQALAEAEKEEKEEEEEDTDEEEENKNNRPTLKVKANAGGGGEGGEVRKRSRFTAPSTFTCDSDGVIDLT
jgi:hypothetical protein